MAFVFRNQINSQHPSSGPGPGISTIIQLTINLIFMRRKLGWPQLLLINHPLEKYGTKIKTRDLVTTQPAHRNMLQQSKLLIKLFSSLKMLRCRSSNLNAQGSRMINKTFPVLENSRSIFIQHCRQKKDSSREVSAQTEQPAKIFESGA